MKESRITIIRNSKVSDEKIVERVLLGEKELYELLIRRYNQKLYRLIVGYLSNPDDIADVMQDTYLKAYEKLYQFKFNSSFSTWLIRIGINEALAKIRYKIKYVQLNKMDPEIQNNLLEKVTPSQLNPEKKVIQKETKRMLEESISNLESKYRVIYILKEIEGMKLSAISECLDISVPNVKVRLHRAKHMIKDELYKISADPDIFEFGSSKCDVLTRNIMQLI